MNGNIVNNVAGRIQTARRRWGIGNASSTGALGRLSRGEPPASILNSKVRQFRTNMGYPSEGLIQRTLNHRAMQARTQRQKPEQPIDASSASIGASSASTDVTGTLQRRHVQTGTLPPRLQQGMFDIASQTTAERAQRSQQASQLVDFKVYNRARRR
jgi:hypothetical protein